MGRGSVHHQRCRHQSSSLLGRARTTIAECFVVNERKSSMRRSRVLITAPVLAAGLLLAGCANDDAGSDSDRKSTRLNSSHVAISYAVFCLKKKNSNMLPETN